MSSSRSLVDAGAIGTIRSKMNGGREMSYQQAANGHLSHHPGRGRAPSRPSSLSETPRKFPSPVTANTLTPSSEVPRNRNETPVAAGGATAEHFADRTPTKGSIPGATSSMMRKAAASPSTKGLRNMSVKICQKVQERGRTTCIEVADELIQVIKKEQKEIGGSDKNCDEKNVRRRVYDALNVLDAIDVIAKDSKNVSWKGLPDQSQSEHRGLTAERDQRKKKVKEKRGELRERLIQQISYRNLVRHNKRRDQAYHVRDADKISTPFVVFSAHPHAEVQCDASRDFSHVMVDVNAPFALHDENSILRQLGFDKTTEADLKQMIPDDMLRYCQHHGLLNDILRRKRVHNTMAPVARKRPSKRKYETTQQPRSKRMRK